MKTLTQIRKTSFINAKGQGCYCYKLFICQADIEKGISTPWREFRPNHKELRFATYKEAENAREKLVNALKKAEAKGPIVAINKPVSSVVLPATKLQ